MPTRDDRDADLQGLLDARIQSNAILATLADRVAELTDDVVALREELTRRPTAAQQRRTRRIVIFVLAVFGIILGHLQDQHVELCGPGARTEAAVDLFLSGHKFDLQDLRDATHDGAPPICDIVRPLHAHSTNRGMERIIGGGLYLAFFIGGGWYVFRRIEEPALPGDEAAGDGDETAGDEGDPENPKQ